MPPCRCQILRLKCTDLAFRWGSGPDPAGGAYSAPPDLAVFQGPISKRKEGKERGGEGEGEGKVKGKEGERRWKGGFGPPKNFGVAPCMA